MKTVVSQISSLVQAIKNCQDSGNSEWQSNHKQKLKDIIYQYLPHGSGYDSNTQIDFEKTTENKIVFNTAFHHMNEDGYYCGWSHHIVTVTPAFDGVNIRISGRNLNGIKNMIAEDFVYSLTCDVTALTP